MVNRVVRKFLLEFPCSDCPDSRPVSRSQALLSDDGGRRIVLVSEGKRYSQQIHTLQQNQWLVQETSLKKAQFFELWPLIQSQPLRCSRRSVQVGGIPCCVDSFSEQLEGLHIASVSFPDSKTAWTWRPPQSLGPEITFNHQFESVSLLKAPPVVRNIPVNLVDHKHDFVVGVLPYLKIPGSVEVVTVLTRKKGNIIFPKGQPEPKLTAAKVARLEAIEEAGIEGQLTAHPILIPFRNRNPHHWILYPMEVTTIQPNWKEKGFRQRSLVKLKDALHHPQYTRLDPALQYLDTWLRATCPSCIEDARTQ